MGFPQGNYVITSTTGSWVGPWATNEVPASGYAKANSDSEKLKKLLSAIEAVRDVSPDPQAQLQTFLRAVDSILATMPN